MPHTNLPPCSSGDGIRGGRERTQSERSAGSGPKGALAPASPPGFVTALTTARSRDVPAECFDERLPRRLPHRGSPGACIYFPPRKLLRSQRAGHLPRMLIFCWPPPHLLRTDAANCNGWAAKMKPGTLKLYKKFRSTRPDAASRATRIGWWIK